MFKDQVLSVTYLTLTFNLSVSHYDIRKLTIHLLKVYVRVPPPIRTLVRTLCYVLTEEEALFLLVLSSDVGEGAGPSNNPSWRNPELGWSTSQEARNDLKPVSGSQART